MREQINISPVHGEEKRNEPEYCAENICINSMLSIESVNPPAKTGISVNTSHTNFQKSDMMPMEEQGDPLSVSTDSNTAPKDIGIAQAGIDSSGPPINIIQQLDDDSEPLINLDSIQDSERESDVSDLNEIILKGDDSKTSWLNIDSSSTQGSQGSYAHQVPAFLGSYESNGININPRPSDSSLRPHNSMSKKGMTDQYQSTHSRASHFLNLDTPQDSNLDDILGPKGELIQYDLGSSDEPLQSDLDDILGPQSDGKPSDLDDTLGPYEGSTVGQSSVLPSGSKAMTGNNDGCDSEYVHFRVAVDENSRGAMDARTDENKSHMHPPICVGAATPENHNPATSFVPSQNGVESSVLSPRITPATSRKTIDSNQINVLGRGNDGSYARSPINASELSENFSRGHCIAFDTAYDSTAFTEVRQPAFTPQVAKNEAGASLGLEKCMLQEQTQKTSSIQQIRHRSSSNDFLESKSSLESKATDHSQVSKSSVDITSESSHGETTDPGNDSATQVDDILSADNQLSTWGSTLSPNSHSRKVGYTFSPGTSEGDGSSFSSSQRDSFSLQSSPAKYNSQSSHHTERTGVTRYSSATLTNRTGSRSHINRFSTAESSQYSRTEHDNGTENTSSRTGSRSRTSRFSTEEACNLSRTKNTQDNHTELTSASQCFSGTSSNAVCSIDKAEDVDDPRDGHLWREALSQTDSSKDRKLSPHAKKFAESIMARTRSRAEPDALIDNPSNVEAVETATRSMINVNSQEEGRFIESTAIAKKRGRVVQLLTVGLLSFLISFLGGFLVLSSCYFVSAAIGVGENAEEFDLHFGLWKYSPADSAFQGYTYCSNYDGDFISDAPWFGRISSLVALLGGAFSLGVLWVYLVLGRCVKKMWNIAVYSAAISGALQLSTLSILSSNICDEQLCTLGPAGIVSIIAGCFYFVLAFEMRYNTPLSRLNNGLIHEPSREESHHMVTNLEMTDFEYGAKSYVQRMIFGSTTPYPITDGNPVGEAVNDRKSDLYVPPVDLV